MAVRDAHGNALAEGDSVQVIKDLKVGGSSMTLRYFGGVTNPKGLLRCSDRL